MPIPRTRQQPGGGNIYLFRARGRAVTFEMLRAFSSGGKKYLEGIDYLGGALCMMYPLAEVAGNAYHPDSGQFVSPQALAERYWIDGDVPPTEWGLAKFPFAAKQMRPLKKEGSGFRVPDEKMLKPRKRDGFDANATLRLTYREFGGGISDIEVWIDRAYDGGVLHNAHCRAMDNECYATLLASRVVSCIDLDADEPVADVMAFLRRQKQEGTPTRKPAPTARRPEARIPVPPPRVVQTPEERLRKAMGKLGDIIPALVYVSRADGSLAPHKLEILRSVVRRVAPDDDIADEMIDRAVKNVSGIDRKTARAAVDRIAAASPRQMAGLYKISRRLTGASAQPSRAETAILEYMAKRIGVEED